MAEYRRTNGERLSKSQTEWRRKNSKRKRANDLLWQAKNPEKVKLFKRVSEQRRRAAKRSSVGHYSAGEITLLYQKQKGRCTCCNKSLSLGYHIDHIEPLCRGGTNHISNIQLLCQPCNNRKSGKDPIKFMQEMGFLL